MKDSSREADAILFLRVSVGGEIESIGTCCSRDSRGGDTSGDSVFTVADYGA